MIRTFIIFFLLGAGALALTVTLSGPQIVTVNVSEDASVKRTEPDINFGSDTKLYIHNNESSTNVTYLKFDASALEYKIKDILTIDAFALSNSSARSADVYLITNAVYADAWSESTITWTTAPGMDPGTGGLVADAGIKLGAFDKPEKNVSQTVGLTFDSPEVKAAWMHALNSGSRQTTLVMVRSPDRYQTYSSRENTMDSVHPVRMNITPGQMIYRPPVIESVGVWQQSGSDPNAMIIQSPLLTLLPSLSRPPDRNPPTLRWPISLGLAPYTVVYGKTPALTDGQQQAPVKDTFLRPFNAFTPGQWYWKVIAGDGTESPTASFTITSDLPVWEIPSWESLLAQIPDGHPRVYIRPETLDALRTLADGEYSGFIRELMDRYLEKKVGAPIPPLPPRNGDAEKEYVNHEVRPLVNLHFLYQITGDSRFAEEIRRRTLHFIQYTPVEFGYPNRSDFANSWIVASFGCAYDSLYDQWSDEEKALIAGAIFERIGLGAENYLPGKINDQQQINTGPHAWQWVIRNLTIGALALYREYPEARDFFEWSLKMHVAMYPWFGGADGGSAECAQYYKGTGFHTAAEAGALFGAATGVNFFDHPWYQNTMWYLMYAQGVSNMCSQFGDRRGGMDIGDKEYSTSRVFAGRTGSPYFSAYWNELQNRYRKLEAMDWIPMVLEQLEPFSFGPPQPLGDLPKARCFKDIGVVFMRSDIANPTNDILFEFRSSPYGSTGHSHADQNSFNISAYGDPLILDSGYYDKFGSDHRRQWTATMQAHNTVLVSNTGMHPGSWESFGQITDFEIGSNQVYTAGSCSKGYDQVDVKRFDRQILWVQPNTYMIVDSLETAEPQTFQWLLHAVNEITIDHSSKTLNLTNNNAAARVQFFNPDNPAVPPALTIIQTNEFTVNPDSSYNAEPTPNQWHLTASTTASSTAQRFITVIQVCRSSEVALLPTASVTVSGAEVTLKLNGQSVGSIALSD